MKKWVEHRMKNVVIGKYAIPSWILGVALASICISAFALYATLTFTIPFEVKEPLEILDYPSQVSLYPGDTFYFNVTIANHASQNYTVFLTFSLGNTTYDWSYVTFSNTTYTVESGINNLPAWLVVSGAAPPISATLTVNVYRQTTTTTVPEESIQMYKLHTWHNGSNFAETAFLIINTGGRDLVLDKVTVRGQECAWTDVFYNKTTDTINSDLPWVAYANLTSGGTVKVGTTNYEFAAGALGQDLILQSGDSMIIYIRNPDNISVNDIGVTVGVTIFTANAQYYKESNVEAAQ